MGETTVLIGQNDAGKTALLEALRIVLSRRWGTRGTGFTEYDVFQASSADDPKKSEGITIQITLEESTKAEWPQAVHDDLTETIQIDPLTGTGSIALRVTCKYEEAAKSFEPKWEFLGADGKPVTGRAARSTNLNEFFPFVPVFYLPALRDVGDEFSTRSQFWARLLKSVVVPEAVEEEIRKGLEQLNAQLLSADPRLAEVAKTLQNVHKVVPGDGETGIQVRALPMHSWDLLSRAEVIVQSRSDAPWLPIAQHGQGVQSLSVIFLLEAFIRTLLSSLYRAESAPLIALEEPEAHLHPQAARSVWWQIKALPGQKITATHSPYFMQNVPFRDIRLLRLTDSATTVSYLPETYSVARVPANDPLNKVISDSNDKFHHNAVEDVLTVKGRVEEREFRELLMCFAGADRDDTHRALRDLYDRSAMYIDDSELEQLETWARRIRGEIFFAKKWLLCEGQSEHVLIHAVADTVGYSLDSNGVAVIDCQNSGSPGSFAALSRAFAIPWLSFCDKDRGGEDFLRLIRDRGFRADEMQARCRQLPEGDLEQYLVKNGFENELRQIAIECGAKRESVCEVGGLIEVLRKDKLRYAAALARRIRLDGKLVDAIPAFFKDLVQDLKALT